MKKEKINKIDIILDLEDIVLYVKVNDEMFKHHYTFNDLDDLCVRVQKKYDAPTAMINDMWSFIIENWELLKKGETINFVRDK